MDTLLIKKLVEIRSLQDSLVLHSKEINYAISKLESENLLLKFLPFLGVIVGGALTYYGQKVLKEKEYKIATSRAISDSINQVFINVTQLNFLLKELAYLEVDSKFQHYLACTETGENSKKALDEHYTDYKYISETKSKISNSLGSIISGFSSYYKLQNMALPPNTTTILNTFSNHLLNLPRQTDYPIPTPNELSLGQNIVTDSMTSSDFTRLSDIYISPLFSIKELANNL
jgi:hypothetical protein